MLYIAQIFEEFSKGRLKVAGGSLGGLVVKWEPLMPKLNYNRKKKN